MHIHSVTVINLFLQLYPALADVVRTGSFAMSPERDGVGDRLAEVADVSVMNCGSDCSLTDGCNAANYDPANHTCTLLHVHGFQDDWLNSQGDVYLYADTEIDLTASVGFWPFIDDVSNLRNTSAVVATNNTPFVPAVPGGSTNVISFLGDINSYVALENNGDLAVTSFTWMAKLYPEAGNIGPLFNWYLSESAVCGYHGPYIWFIHSRLSFNMCTGTPGAIDTIPRVSQRTTMTLNVWHDVAVSYDFTTGSAQLRTDDVTETFYTGQFGAGHTTGPVVMGTRHHYSGPVQDTRAFQGKMACVRLWNITTDLANLGTDSSMCKIN